MCMQIMKNERFGCKEKFATAFKSPYIINPLKYFSGISYRHLHLLRSLELNVISTSRLSRIVPRSIYTRQILDRPHYLELVLVLGQSDRGVAQNL